MKRLAAAGLILAAFASAQPPVLRLTAPGNRPVEIHTGGEKITVVIFVSALCPVSSAYHDRFKQMLDIYRAKPVEFVFVNANDNETMKDVIDHVKGAELPFVIYKDWKNAAADALGASMTPEAFVVDRQGRTVYHGAFDDAKNEARVKIPALKNAIDATLAGKPVPRAEMKAFGCTIHRYRKST